MTRNLADCCSDVTTIADVVRVLSAVRDASAEDIMRPEVDGISCFSRLYTIITQNVLDTVEGRKPKREFKDPDFLTLLDLEFARRYIAAIRAYEGGRGDTPKSWDVLFERRRKAGIGHVNFAAAGVNAHVNYDLAFALLETWRTFPPNADRRSDYDQVNEIFAEEMDQLREDFDAFLADVAPDGSPVDRFGNAASDLLVRITRALAWEAAEEVWAHHDPKAEDGGPAYRKAYDRMERRLDRTAWILGWGVLTAPDLP
ncbi:DUF5995 family protein [Pseudonocardia yuanmonensis]|uniref:DUF5995 family protein n=1 Tax=Pseudonocardia yuanmonensis TaxID=1095914 RepID=A0ABP8W4U9_9PSEU